jgi:MFS family permease
MPLRILRLRSLSGASVARGMLATGMFSTFFLGALYLKQIRGFDAFTIGLAFLPFTLALGVLSLGITAGLMGRFGPQRLLIGGLTLITASLLLLSSAGEQTSYFPRILAAFLLFGIGAGTSFMPLLTIAMSEVPPADAGLASGITNVTMQVFAAIGLAALGTVSTDHARALVAEGHSLTSALTSGYQLAFLISAVCVAAALAVVLLVLRAPRRAGGRGRLERPEAASPDREVEAEAA